MQQPEDGIETFAARWVEEFGRAIQMFTGEEPELSFVRGQMKEESAAMATCAWWKQTVQSKESFSIWAGVAEPAWSAVGGAAGDGGNAQATFFEMVSQANQGAVSVLSAGFPDPLKCLDGLVEEPPAASSLVLSKIQFSFKGEELPPLLLLIQPEAFRILNPQTAIATVQQPPAILARLMDLQLPVSVLLGRSAMRIKDVLKITPGSVIELDREIGDFVEIMVQGTIVAKGEIVSVKGNYGVRIKEIISRQDRIALHQAA